MRDLQLVIASLRSRWLGNLLSVALTGFGFMLALAVLLFGAHIQNRLGADGQGVDIVIGAKGSPLQLILSSVYHLDIPTGNISYEAAQKWMKHPQVKSTIPLALGDQWRGRRIVGTTPDYAGLYGAEIREGRLWSEDFEVVAGASTGLRIGDSFHGSHGFSSGGHEHDDHAYKVVGVFAPSGSVIDRLILTSVASVMELHGQHLEDDQHDHEDHGHEHDHDHEQEHDHADEPETPPEITALLIQTKGPLAQMNLPRLINKESALQAASPAFEMARLTAMFGVGSRLLAGLSAFMIGLAVLSVFAGLSSHLSQRSADMAILRTLGYGRMRLALLLIGEGGLIALAGLAAGAVFTLAATEWALSVSPALKESGFMLDFTAPGVGVVAAFVFIAGLCSAIIPAWRAAGADVSRQLSSY